MPRNCWTRCNKTFPCSFPAREKTREIESRETSRCLEKQAISALPRKMIYKLEFVKEEYTVNIGFWLCGVLVIPFVIIGVLFAIFKEKAAKFVSGFNSLPKEEQALYDKAHISRDIKNQCFTWAGIMLVGAVLSYFLTPYMAIPAFIIWLVLFFKEVHFDTHKAFEKYLLK